MKKPTWETAIRSCRARVKGTACFGIEDPLHEVQSRNEMARKGRIILDSLREVSVTYWVVSSSPEVDFGAFPVGNT